MSTLAYPVTNRELLKLRRRVRRNQIIRRRVAFGVLAVFLILLFTFFLSSITIQANDDNTDVTYKYFTSYEVCKGDTLWTLAKDNINYEFYENINDYIDEVIEINHLDNENIFVGQCIIIPYFSNDFY